MQIYGENREEKTDTDTHNYEMANCNFIFGNNL